MGILALTPRIWREGATPEELAAVLLIDEQMAELARVRRVIADDRQHIINRACQRARVRRRKVITDKC